MELGPLLAAGRTAKVYRWKKDCVIKLFREDIPLEAVEREYKASRFVYEAGLPVPHVGKLLRIGSRWGIEYEEVAGVSLLQCLLRKPTGFLHAARLLAELHLQVHQVSVPRGQFLPLKDRLERSIRSLTGLAEPAKEEIRIRLAELAEGSALCHFDFHPENVMVTESGPVIIDWMNTSAGDPAADVARTWMILSQARVDQPGSESEFWASQARMAEEYLVRYLEAGTVSRDTINQWVLPVAAARLAEGIRSEKENLLRLIDSLL